MNLPKKQRGATKYGGKGPYSFKSFNHLNIPLAQINTLVTSANHAGSKSTWCTYRTAYNMLNKCQEHVNKDLSLPLDESKTLIFVAWCIDKGNACSTIKSYLSGLKAMHNSEGLGDITLLTPMVEKVLLGKDHMPEEKISQKRLPCTLNSLRLLKVKLRSSSLQIHSQIAIWALCSLAFFGAFRIGELLCKYTQSYDPAYTLLKKDVSIKKTKEGHS